MADPSIHTSAEAEIEPQSTAPAKLLAAREVALKERELGLKERELDLKSKEAGLGWTSPVVVGLLAAAIGLAGNLAVALLNARATLSLERYKARASLITEIVKTGNKEEALTNLKFFVDNALIEDPDGSLHKALTDPNAIPFLPRATTSGTDTANCYRLANMTNHQVVVTFEYPGGPPTFSPVSISVLPNAQFIDCFPVGSVIAKIVTPKTLWQNQEAKITLGNTSGALPPGTYRMVPVK